MAYLCRAILSFLLLSNLDPAIAESINKSVHIKNVNDGGTFKNDLISSIQEADRIVVTEHSDQYDLFSPKTMKSLIPELIYVTKVLTQEQKSKLETEIKKISKKPNYWITACIFEPHHTIDFYFGETHLSELKICFKCGEVNWDKNRNLPPGALVGVLAQFIDEIGLHSTRDWSQLAKEKYRQLQENH